MSGPAVSIVVPAYEVAAYIGDAMASIFAQSFTDFETIVVNDGSPDTEQLEKVLAPFRARIHYLRQANQGAAEARNAALRIAQGEFIAFLDADDAWMPTYLAEQVAFLRGHEAYDLVYTDAALFGAPSMVGRTYMGDSPSSGPVTFESLLTARCNVLTSGVVVRRSAVIETEPFDVELRAGQDYDLWLRMVRRGVRMTYQRKPLVRRRVRMDGLSGDEFAMAQRELNVLERFGRRNTLNASERTLLESVLAQVRSKLHVERGKRELAAGQFGSAADNFEEARQLSPTWKLRLVAMWARVAPALLRWVQNRRTPAL